MNGKKAVRVIGGLLTLLLLIFAYQYIAELVGKADLRSTSIGWLWVVASVVAFVAYYSLLSIHWRMACEMIDPDDLKASEKQYLSFFASQPYKYLPTSLFTFSYRAVYAKRLGLGLGKSSAAQMVEYASMLSANFFLFAVLYAATVDTRIVGVLLASGLLGTVGVLRIKKFSISLKGKNLHIDPPKLVRMVGLATGAWLLCGVSFVFLNQALGFPIHFAEMVAANCLAFSLSILAVFAPGGIGVRELIYSSFSISSVAIIYWRILTFILDMTLGGLAILAVRTKTTTQD